MPEQIETVVPRPKKKKKAAKGKAVKKKIPQVLRLEKAKKWLAAYTGDDVLKAYRKKFAADRMQAIQELQLLGLSFSEERIAKEKKAVQARLQQEKAKKAKRRARRLAAKEQNPAFAHPDQSDTFFYIAGYTSGGAPYGVTWEDMGINPWDNLDGD